MQSESKARSLLKAVSWRIIASIVTTLIAYSFGLPAKAIGLVFFADLIIKFILYFIHERVWVNFIKFGIISEDKSRMLSSCEKSKLINLIKELGKEAETIKKSSIEYSYKDDNSPLSAADTLVNNELNQFVKQTDFKNIISEENEFISYDERKKWEYFWLIDPIDGTKEYIKKEMIILSI